MTKQEVILQVQDSLGSLFTKDDVVKCINMVVEEPKVETKVSYPSKEWLDKIKNSILERVKDVDFNDSDMFDISDFEFDITHGNQIEVDSYEVDACSLKGYVENQIEEAFDELEDDIVEIQEEDRLNENDALKEANEL
jgi:hypothetical protein